jgi:SHS2 domain-containing protein
VFEIIEHTADVGLRVCAENVDALFADAARGMFSLIVDDLEQVRPLIERRVTLSADSLENLLADWLSELLYIFETRKAVFAHFTVRVTANTLVAIVAGEPFDLERHHTAHEIKAVTYHGLTVGRTPSGWVAEVILDI